MIILNFTGLSRPCWKPAVFRNTDREGLWYLTIRWLGAELSIFSVAMADGMIKILHKRTP